MRSLFSNLINSPLLFTSVLYFFGFFFPPFPPALCPARLARLQLIDDEGNLPRTGALLKTGRHVLSVGRWQRGVDYKRVEHHDVPPVRFLFSFSLQAPQFVLLKPFKFACWLFRRLFFSLLSAFFFLCSSFLHLNLAGPLSASLTVGGGGAGWREGRSAALTAGGRSCQGREAGREWETGGGLPASNEDPPGPPTSFGSGGGGVKGGFNSHRETSSRLINDREETVFIATALVVCLSCF